MAVWQRCRDERDLAADRAAKDRSGAEVEAVRGDGAFRTARLARVRRGGHLRAEQLLKETAPRVPLPPSRVFAHLILPRDRIARRGSRRGPGPSPPSRRAPPP